MNPWIYYAIAGMTVFCIGLYGLLGGRHILRRILALNVMSTGVFMVIIAMADRQIDSPPDPVPHAIVLTGIVVAVSFSALLLGFVVKLNAQTGTETLPEFQDRTEDEPHP